MGRPTIAVVGASTNRSKFGNKCVRAYAAVGYHVYPINPNADKIEGHKVWQSLAETPVEQFDRISIYLPPDKCLDMLPQLTAKPAREVWFNPGADDPQVLDRARSLGLNVVVGCSIIDVGISPSDLPD